MVLIKRSSCYRGGRQSEFHCNFLKRELSRDVKFWKPLITNMIKLMEHYEFESNVFQIWLSTTIHTLYASVKFFNSVKFLNLVEILSRSPRISLAMSYSSFFLNCSCFFVDLRKKKGKMPILVAESRPHESSLRRNPSFYVSETKSLWKPKLFWWS